tara:strand:- start:3278 stop:4531 length:1254 start_codon:yes stop_codon:yes gene_type:complete
MAIVKSASNKNNRGSINPKQKSLLSARVLDIILDINHPLAEENGGYDAIGTIFYSLLEETNQNKSSLTANKAFPLFSHLKYFPLINEIVLIVETSDKDIYTIEKTPRSYYLPQINMWGHPHHNALPTSRNQQSSANDYEQSLGAGLVRKVEDGGTDIDLGVYFQEQLNIKPLLPYEGDMILEGRFGNSIRFGSTNISDSITNVNGWSNSGETGDPITIIRNGQSSNEDEKGWLPTTEKVNEDASSIYLCSNQQLSNFIQSSPFMESWDAQYIRPETIEQALLDPAPNPHSLGPEPPLTPTNSDPNLNYYTTPPPGNEEVDVTVTPETPRSEPDDKELAELDNFPETAGTEVEDIPMGEGIDKDTEASIGSDYEDPGTGGGGDGGEESLTFDFDYEIPGFTSVQDNTAVGNNAGFGGL